jgi:glycosyltransferase involved in cell wall biosynthesis
MITTFYPPYNFGGDGIYVQRLSNALAQRGHHVEVIHCVDAYYASGGRRKREMVQKDHPNVTVHALESPFGFLSPLATQQTGFPLLKTARILKVLESGFDVIHYHNISLVGGPKILEYGKGIKLYTMHEYWLICPTHVLFKFNREVCTSRSCLLCQATYLRPPQWWRYTGLLDASVRQVDVFISPDRFSLKKHQQMGLNVPIVYLPHFVPMEESSVTTSVHTIDHMPEKPYFLFVGRLEKLKGLQSIIPFFRRYPRAKLLIAGIGNLEQELRELAAGSANIEFLGFVSGDALQTLYRNTVALIVPSINFEVAPPLVIMEAFRQHTPVIVRDLGSMPEIIEESGGGCLFDSEADLIAAVDRLITNSSYRHELGERGYQAYLQKWTEDNHLKQYLELIHGIRNRKRVAMSAARSPGSGESNQTFNTEAVSSSKTISIRRIPGGAGEVPQ